MDLGRPATTIEAQAPIVKVQNYTDMWTRRSHVLDPPTEADSSPKCRKILWNDGIEIAFKELKRVVSSETM